MKHLLNFVLLATCSLLLATSSFAQDLQSVSAEQDLGARLPLVTAGSALGWLPSGDEAEFTLPESAFVRLSIYSPSIETNEIGDELSQIGNRGVIVGHGGGHSD